MRSSFLTSSKRSLSSSFLLAISRLNEAVTLRSKQPSLIHTYRTKKGSTLTSLFAHALGGPNFPRGVPILQENLFRAELIFGGSKFCVTVQPWIPGILRNASPATSLSASVQNCFRVRDSFLRFHFLFLHFRFSFLISLFLLLVVPTGGVGLGQAPCARDKINIP